MDLFWSAYPDTDNSQFVKDFQYSYTGRFYKKWDPEHYDEIIEANTPEDNAEIGEASVYGDNYDSDGFPKF
jgi:hypothetical protein